MLISKLLSFGTPFNLPTLPLDADNAMLDLLDRDTMDWAKRAVLSVLGGARMVAIVFEDLNVAGVEVSGLESLDRSMDSEMVDAWSAESSNAGSEGNEGMSSASTS